MRIGITTRKIEVNGKESFILYKRYIDFYKNHEIVLLMPFQSSSILELCDCFILTGGDDLNPTLYNQNNYSSNNVDDDIDNLDMLVINHALKANKKVLGICRGIQSINVYFGGTLKQDKDCHMNVSHKLLRINKIKGIKIPRKLYVNSYHHQVLDVVGEELNVISKCEDEIVEIIQHKNNNILGVQFHPEIDLENSFYRQILNFILS